MGTVELGGVEARKDYPYRARLTAWLVFVGVLTAVNWAGRLSEGTPDKNSAYQWNVAVGAAVQFVFLLGIIALMARARGPSSVAGAGRAGPTHCGPSAR